MIFIKIMWLNLPYSAICDI